MRLKPCHAESNATPRRVHCPKDVSAGERETLPEMQAERWNAAGLASLSSHRSVAVYRTFDGVRVLVEDDDITENPVPSGRPFVIYFAC